MKLKVAFELPLTADSGQFVEIIAKTHGWQPESGLSVEEYTAQRICEPAVRDLFKSLTISALSAYFGLSGAQEVERINRYVAEHQVAFAQFVEE